MSEPRTEAGRRLASQLISEDIYAEEDILAIEREAAVPQPLDVEGVVADLLMAESELEMTRRSLVRTTDILARLSRKEPSDE